MSESPYIDAAAVEQMLAAYQQYGLPAVGLPDLPEFAQHVTQQAIKNLMISRTPSFLDDASNEQYLAILWGVTTEVAAIVGSDPQDPTVRNLAVWAITLGVAAYIEASIAPEQQLGDESASAESLQRRFLAILAQLRGTAGTGPGGSIGHTLPSGDFPPPASADPALPPLVWSNGIAPW